MLRRQAGVSYFRQNLQPNLLQMRITFARWFRTTCTPGPGCLRNLTKGIIARPTMRIAPIYSSKSVGNHPSRGFNPDGFTRTSAHKFHSNSHQILVTKLLKSLAILSSLLAAFLAFPTIASAQTPCRQALALGLDVSGSVDAREYRLQMDGLAQALSTPQVQRKILQQPETPIMLLVYEWSGPSDQHTVLPWTALTSKAQIAHVVEALRTMQRREASPGTALGEAMKTGAAHLAQQPCWTKTLDISGDGKSNLGIRPRDAKPHLQSITINGLVIGADAPAIGDARQTELSELSAYFHAEVILGTDAFVEASIGFDDYANAMQRKLLREVQGMQLSMR